MTNINFITCPRIFKVGQTRIDYDGIHEFTSFISEESGKNPKKLNDLLDKSKTDIDVMAELAGRVCYQSYFSGRDSEEYIEHIKEDQHGNVFEHPTVNFIITGVSRSLTHELIRHRVGTAISEMSQRFVGANEKSGKWNFVVPAAIRDVWNEDSELRSWYEKTARQQIEQYLSKKHQLESFYSKDPSSSKKKVLEAAREMLPNWIETRGVWSVNMRQVRHILDKRGSEHADKQIRDFSIELLSVLHDMNSLIMNDVTVENGVINTKFKGV